MTHTTVSPHATDLNDLDTIIGLIELAEMLSDEEKDAMLATLQNEGLTKDLKQKLIAMCDKEAAHLDGEIRETERITEGLRTLAQEENAHTKEESARLAALAAQAMSSSAQSTSQAMSDAVTQFDKSLESHAQSADAAKAEAIRKNMGL